jgi:hypothetical protein
MIIGLAGYARSGKNTVADLLGHKYKQVAFADPMRNALYKLNPIINTIDGVDVREAVDELEWDTAKDHFPEIRRLLQVLGTEVGRHMIHENVWVDIALRGMLPTDDVVFTDVRFINEAVAIKKLGGEVWRIDREGVGAVNGHISEHALKDWEFDRIIENNGTIEDLMRAIA